MFRFCRSAALLTLVCIGVGLRAASGPTFWTVASAAEFLRGTSNGVFVSVDGALSAAPAMANRLTSIPGQVWSLASADDGTLWAGTGGDGRLLRLRTGQPEDTAFDAPEPHIFAIATFGTRVYAASSPDGRVYLIEGTSPARPWFDPEERYIWTLTVDATGSVWVGTGSPATIYRVEPDGTGRLVYRAPASHVVSLVADRQGRVLAGTESPGRLYRIGADLRPFALLDAGAPEVRAVAVAADDTVYAAAVNRGDAPASGGDTAPVVTSLSTIVDPQAAGAPPANRRSVLYRIDPAGGWEPVWETTDVVYDLAAVDGGAVLAATGPDGKLYRLEVGRRPWLLTGVDAHQITRFAHPVRPAAGPPAFATANPGRVLAPSPAATEPATFTSAVRDSRSHATWGQLRWEGSGAVTFHTRSGNTTVPDDSWTEWAGPLSRAEGEQVPSPPARFIQWRATFPRQGQASVTSVTLAYLTRNSRPAVTSLTVHPPGVVFARPFSSEDGAIAGLDEATADARRPPGDTPQPASPGRRMFQKGLQTFQWKAEDADGDRLSYSVQYRREGEATWRDLRSGLTDSLFVWDTTSVPDGRYLVRVLATDRPVNPDDRALAGDRESDPFDIDNTPPSIATETTRQGAAIRVTVRVRDTHSPIQKFEYAVAGGAWLIVYPADGLADSLEERFEFTLPAGTDLSSVMVRAADRLQNVAAAAVSPPR